MRTQATVKDDKQLRRLWLEYVPALQAMQKAQEADSYVEMNREHQKLIRIAKAIRKAKAETPFGIGVKLSASEHFLEQDAVEALEDARRSVSALAGIDFVATTGPVVRL